MFLRAGSLNPWCCGDSRLQWYLSEVGLEDLLKAASPISLRGYQSVGSEQKAVLKVVRCLWKLHGFELLQRYPLAGVSHQHPLENLLPSNIHHQILRK